MPPPRKPPRLWTRKERRTPDGKLISRAQQYIIDGRKHVATGCSPDEVAEATRILADYLSQAYRPKRKERDIEHIDVADVLLVYNDDRRDKQVNKRTFDERLIRLTEWFGGKMLSDVNGETCRAYVAHRQSMTGGGHGGARRDLEDLRAAINHHAKDGLHRGMVNVWLPPKGEAKDRWLTRDEAARLLWTCWRYREQQRGQSTAKYPLRHLARFVQIGLYTGSRSATILAASPIRADGHSWVDLHHGLFYRRQVGKAATNKRQPSVPVEQVLLSAMRRWNDGRLVTHFVEFAGKPIASVKVGWASAVEKAGLSDDVTPHTLRHTAATWMMQRGVPIWEAAGYLGMSVEILQTTYGHHSPHHMKGALASFRARK